MMDEQQIQTLTLFSLIYDAEEGSPEAFDYIMFYPVNFEGLKGLSSQTYWGYGNPHARILFLGQSPDLGVEIVPEQKLTASEVLNNRTKWMNLIASGSGFKTDNKQYGSPLTPNSWQCFSERESNGTSKTLYNYQKLINLIFGELDSQRKPMDRDSLLDFYHYAFLTDMSSKVSSDVNGEVIGSVRERKTFLSSNFFREIPVVIAAVGHFPRDTYGNAYIGDVFGVDYIGNEGNDEDWINISLRKRLSRSQIVIHTRQFSGLVSDSLLKNIASRIISFVNETGISLFPTYK